MTEAGAGEQQLLTMLSAMGPHRDLSAAQEWMDSFIPPTDDGSSNKT